MLASLFSCSEEKKDELVEEKIPVEDTSQQPCCGEIIDPNFISPFEKLDNSILMPLFKGEFLDEKGSVHWRPTWEEITMNECAESLCSTRIEEVHYFKTDKKEYAFCLFVTFDEFAAAGYHSSAPFVGGATFIKNENGKWDLRRLKKLITRHGEMGYLKSFYFDRAGDGKEILVLDFNYTATGQTIEIIRFFDLFSYIEIFSMDSGGNYDSGEENELTYDYSVDYTFNKSKMHNEYYDIVTTAKGTKRDYDKDLTVSADTVIKYRFDELRGIYLPVSENE